MSLRRPTPSAQPGQEKAVCIGVQGLSLKEISRIDNPNKQSNDSRPKMPASCQDVGVLFLDYDQNATVHFESAYMLVLMTARDFHSTIQGDAQMSQTGQTGILTVAGINWTAIQQYNINVRQYYTLDDGKTTILDTTKAFPEGDVDGLATTYEEAGERGEGGKRRMETKVGDFKKIWIDEMRARTRGAERKLLIPIEDSVWIETLQEFNESEHNPPVMIVIDTQIDFAQQDRSFTILGCESMVPDICSCLSTFNGPVVCSRDYQPVADKSFALKAEEGLTNEVGAVCTDGPFPPHCIIPSTMGDVEQVTFAFADAVTTDTKGSELVPQLVKVLEERLDDPKITYKETYVVFKGMFRNYDSFGMFPYDDTYNKHNRTLQSRFGTNIDEEAYKTGATGSYVYKGAADGLTFVQLFRFPKPNDEQQKEYMEYTKAMLSFDPVWTSPRNSEDSLKTQDEIEKDLTSKEEKVMQGRDEEWEKFDTGLMNCLLPRGGDKKNTVFVCGVCLTFCVIDTAMNLKSMRPEIEVIIVVDLTRASNVRLPQDNVFPSLKGNPAPASEYADPRGYLNSPLYLLAICKIYGIKLCTVQDLVRAGYCEQFEMSTETTKVISGSGAFAGTRGGSSGESDCPPDGKRKGDGSCVEDAIDLELY